MNLKEMCEALGVSRRTVQGYEEAGLLWPAGRNKYGYLVYDETSLRRAQKIRYLQEMGFKLKEIAALIDTPEDELNAALEMKAKEMRAQIRHLQELVEETERLLADFGSNERRTEKLKGEE